MPRREGKEGRRRIQTGKEDRDRKTGAVWNSIALPQIYTQKLSGRLGALLSRGGGGQPLWEKHNSGGVRIEKGSGAFRKIRTVRQGKGGGVDRDWGGIGQGECGGVKTLLEKGGAVGRERQGQRGRSKR